MLSVDCLRQSGHDAAAFSSARVTGESHMPLSMVSASLTGVVTLETLVCVYSRAEAQTLVSEKLRSLSVELAVEVVDSGELRRSDWKASVALATAVPAGRLPPHCSHALLPPGPMTLFDALL